jgi:hypothetical protein
MEEIRSSLNEPSFIQLCKTGNLTYGQGYNKIELNITSLDMVSLTKGEIIEKEITWDNKNFKIVLQDIGSDVIREIVRRSPIYSHLYYDI